MGFQILQYDNTDEPLNQTVPVRLNSKNLLPEDRHKRLDSLLNLPKKLPDTQTQIFQPDIDSYNLQTLKKKNNRLLNPFWHKKFPAYYPVLIHRSSVLQMYEVHVKHAMQDNLYSNFHAPFFLHFFLHFLLLFHYSTDFFTI